MGVPDESKGVRVYWPDKKSVSTEWNFYFNKTQSSVSHIEGEDWELPKVKSDNPPVSSHNPPVLSHNPPVLPAPLKPPIPQIAPELSSENDEDPSEPKIPTNRICKPNC